MTLADDCRRLAEQSRVKAENMRLDRQQDIARERLIYTTLAKAADAIDEHEHHFLLADHLRRQADWSSRTFGPGARVAGVVDHLRKELDEVVASGGDLCEWIDVVILGLDGCWRSGASPEQIIEALRAKQARNESRTWPDWRTADPNRAIEHDRTADGGAACA